MKAKKWLVVVLSAVMALAVALGIGACGVKKGYDHKDDTWVWTANADGTTHNGKASCDDRSHDVLVCWQGSGGVVGFSAPHLHLVLFS